MLVSNISTVGGKNRTPKKLSLYLIKHHIMICEEVEVKLYVLILAIDRGESAASRFSLVSTRERAPINHLDRRLVGPRAGLDVVGKKKNCNQTLIVQLVASEALQFASYNRSPVAPHVSIPAQILQTEPSVMSYN
jgi:hypothetical protein